VSTTNTYRIGNAVAVTQCLPDGTWLATFPGFTGFGAVEEDALDALAAEVEGASKRLRLQAIEVADRSSESSEPLAVIIRTHTVPNGEVCGQIISAVTGQILHESPRWPLPWRKDARRDAEQIAQRKGYRVVDVVEVPE
jgi:hypothetical protein